MDIYKLDFTKLELETLNYLSLKAGEKLSQRETAQALRVSPTAIANAVKKLREKNLITMQATKTINFISYNRDNPEAITHKKIENQRQLHTSGLTQHLEEQLAGATIILFGSYAKGEDTTTSDIDIAAIGRKKKNINLTPYEKTLGRTININHYDKWDDIHKNLKDNILNGITLTGAVRL
ncbi:nucleotidyltransferase domain-containing protein [Candidatus Woesearchaeota archaeon]|nr:nucleotidyltransferase domain-containing protein [Candidatus Woesearchaeota archaeon]